MAAYRQVYDSRHLQADCQEPGSAPEPYTLGNGVWATFTFFKYFPAPVASTGSAEFNLRIDYQKRGKIVVMEARLGSTRRAHLCVTMATKATTGSFSRRCELGITCVAL